MTGFPAMSNGERTPALSHVQSGGKKPNDWLNPINKLKYREAVKAKKKEVKIGYTIYTIEYDLPHWPDCVKIKRKDEFIPMGIFPISKIMDDSWIEE